VDGHNPNPAAATAIQSRVPRISAMILQRAVILVALFVCGTPPALAQASSGPPAADPFAAGRWHAQFAAHAAAEAWNYNISREETLGISQGVMFGLRDGLALTATERIYYVSQQGNDAWVLGLTTGLRMRVYRRSRLSVFADFGLGISDTSIATPPRGTRFNYLATTSAGTLVPVGRRLFLLANVELLHISNNGLKGPSRNPDTEALGIGLGLLVRL
jgi:hypothetical protein